VPQSRVKSIATRRRIKKKGKEEIYLGLEIVAVTENATHDEGKRKEEWDEGQTRGERGLFIYVKRTTKHRILISRALHPISVSRAPSPSRFSPPRPFLPFSSIPQRFLNFESSSPFS
jgi:hypothetical protein